MTTGCGVCSEVWAPFLSRGSRLATGPLARRTGLPRTPLLSQRTPDLHMPVGVRVPGARAGAFRGEPDPPPPIRDPALVTVTRFQGPVHRQRQRQAGGLFSLDWGGASGVLAPLLPPPLPGAPYTQCSVRGAEATGVFLGVGAPEIR